MLNVSDAMKHGFKWVIILTTDNDVAVIGVWLFIGADELCLGLGSRKSLNHISIHDL